MYKCNHCHKTYKLQTFFINHLLKKHKHEGQKDVTHTQQDVESISELNDPYLAARSKKYGMYIVFNFSIYNLNN